MGRRGRWLGPLAAVAAIAGVGLLTAGFWIPAKAELAQYLLERSWRLVLAGRTGAKPWPWADTTPVARLWIPGIDQAWIVLAGASGRNLAFAPAQLDGSAPPGKDGVTVIAGHRDTHFESLGELRIGDAILLEDAAGETHAFRVNGTEIVDSRSAMLRLDADSPVLVLTTCYPFDALTAGGPLRYLVFADAADTRQARVVQNANASVSR